MSKSKSGPTGSSLTKSTDNITVRPKPGRSLVRLSPGSGLADAETSPKPIAELHPQSLYAGDIGEHFAEFENNLLQKLDRMIAASIQSQFKSIQGNVDLLPEVHKSIEFMTSKHEELLQEFSAMKTELSSLRGENEKLKTDIKDLKYRMNQHEQQARDCNVEIQCVPEFPNENISSVISQLFSVVACPINKTDITSCSRIQKVSAISSRPRSIIVKLASIRLRDEVIASCTKFNKTNPTDKLNSSHLGIAGDKKQVFVAEHLSPQNRALHAQARAFKRDNNIKFLWVRGGRILMKKDELASTIWVKDSDTLLSLKL